jgi:hypothetical protein
LTNSAYAQSLKRVLTIANSSSPTTPAMTFSRADAVRVHLTLRCTLWLTGF